MRVVLSYFLDVAAFSWTWPQQERPDETPMVTRPLSGRGQLSREAEYFSAMGRKTRTYCSPDACCNVASFAEGGVESSRFARAGGAGHQHHSVRLFDVAAELYNVALCEPDYIKG